MVLNGSLIKTGKDALTGTILTAAALDLWSKEGKFSKLVGETEDISWKRDRVIWDKNDILLTLPTNDGYNLVNNTIQTSDAASLNQEQGAGNSNELIPDDTDEDGVKKYDRQDIISYANSTEGIDEKTGLPIPKKLLRKAAGFCSNKRNLDELAINFLTLINNLLTFTLSRAEAFFCNVFCPNTTTP